MGQHFVTSIIPEAEAVLWPVKRGSNFYMELVVIGERHCGVM